MKSIQSQIISLLKERKELVTFSGSYKIICRPHKAKGYFIDVYNNVGILKFLDSYYLYGLSEYDLLSVVHPGSQLYNALYVSKPENIPYHINRLLNSFINKTEKEKCLSMISPVTIQGRRIMRRLKRYSYQYRNMRPLGIHLSVRLPEPH